MTAEKSVETTAQCTTEPRTSKFGLIGDNPYSAKELGAFKNTIARAGQDAQFVIHVGDIKSGIESCSDELLTQRVALLNSSPQPLVLTPGDNEWTDCSRLLAGSFDPVERLQWLRRNVFAKQQALGAGGLMIENQSTGRLLDSPVTSGQIDKLGLPENQRWQAGPCQFVTLNITGSGYGLNSGINQDISAAHARANQRWLATGAQLARRNCLPVLVVAIHAEIALHTLDQADFTADLVDQSNPYGWLRRTLHQTVSRFPGTVILLNGDTHRFDLSNPWQALSARQAANESATELPNYGIAPTLVHERMSQFTRIRIFGSPVVNAHIGVQISHYPDRENPLELTVTPNLF